MKQINDAGLAPHDHRHCIDSALCTARNLCNAQGERLTSLRENVLKALWQSHKAQGAYDILHSLNSHSKKKLAPLSVYRALDFLVSTGLAHRIESLNAYIGCPHPQSGHALQFLVCEGCHVIEELADARITQHLCTTATAHHFKPSRTVVEIMGLCATCYNANPT